MAILLPVETTAPEFVPAPITDDEAAAMFRAALNLFRLWGLTDDEAATLLDLPVRTYRRWKAGETRPHRPRRQGAALQSDRHPQGAAHHLPRAAARLCLDAQGQRRLRRTLGAST